MNLQIILKYALIKSIYEEKKDYIDVFVPYLLKILSKAQKPLECEFVQKELEAEFNFKIPESVIDILITRATRRGYTKRKRRVVDLEKKGRDYVQIISSREIEIEKEINNFLEDIKEFLEKSYNFPLPKDEVLNALQSFIRKNLYIVEFFSPQNTVFQEGRLTKIEYYLVDYFKEAKEYKPKYYHILENIFYGILISSLLLYPGIDKVSKKFKTLDIYLDTNF